MARNTGPLITLRGSRATVRGAASNALEILDVGGEAIGTMSVTIDREEATLDSVAIEAGLRGFGYGGEAVRLIEAWAARKGVSRFHALVDATNGLGVYFLLRLGYSPSGMLVRDDGRAALEMMRTPG